MKVLFVFCSILSLISGYILSLFTNEVLMMFLPLAVNLINLGGVYGIYKIFLKPSEIKLNHQTEYKNLTYCNAHSL